MIYVWQVIEGDTRWVFTLPFEAGVLTVRISMISVELCVEVRII